MTTLESAITRAESDLAHVQAALDTAQQVLEVADRAHSTGRRLVKLIRIVAVVVAIGGIAVTAAMLIDRFSQRSGEHGDQATDATDNVSAMTAGDQQPPKSNTGHRS
jgi:hypothetical protein